MARRGGPPAAFLPLGGHSGAGSRNACGLVRVENVFIDGHGCQLSGTLEVSFLPGPVARCLLRLQRPTCPRTPGFIPHPRLGLGWAPGAQRGAGPRSQSSGDLRHRTIVHGVEAKRSNGGEGTHAPLGGKSSQTKGRAMLEVGFEG